MSTIAPEYIVGPTKFGRMFRRSRFWALKILRGWWSEQKKGGIVRAFKTPSGRLYTTVAIIDAAPDLPRRRDESLERRLRQMERDLSEAFTRIAELERRIGARR